MQRVVEQLLAGRDLDQPAEIHHRDPVAQMAHHREVVADEQIGQMELGAQILEQVDDLRLDRDVERRDRLVADHELGIERQRPGDADALALAAAHLVRVAVGEAARQAAQAEDLVDARLERGRGAMGAVDVERLADDLAHLHARIERGIGVLEDRLHAAAKVLRGAPVEPLEIGPVEPDRARGRRHQLEQAARERALAAAGFADQAQRLALADREAHAVDRLDLADRALEHDALGDREVLADARHLHQEARAGRRGRRHARRLCHPAAAARRHPGETTRSAPQRPRLRCRSASGT